MPLSTFFLFPLKPHFLDLDKKGVRTPPVEFLVFSIGRKQKLRRIFGSISFGCLFDLFALCLLCLLTLPALTLPFGQSFWGDLLTAGYKNPWIELELAFVPSFLSSVSFYFKVTREVWEVFPWLALSQVCFSESGGARGHASRLRNFGQSLQKNLEARRTKKDLGQTIKQGQEVRVMGFVQGETYLYI